MTMSSTLREYGRLNTESDIIVKMIKADFIDDVILELTNFSKNAIGVLRAGSPFINSEERDVVTDIEKTYLECIGKDCQCYHLEEEGTCKRCQRVEYITALRESMLILVQQGAEQVQSRIAENMMEKGIKDDQVKEITGPSVIEIQKSYNEIDDAIASIKIFQKEAVDKREIEIARNLLQEKVDILLCTLSSQMQKKS